MNAKVIAVSRKATHKFSKNNQLAIDLVAGFGVSGDAHYGQTVQHRYDKKKDPNRPNLRQVHLIQSELFDWVANKGYAIAPGDLGENITTRGIDLLALPLGTRLKLGESAIVELTGLRHPCKLINSLGQNLMDVMKDSTPKGEMRPKAGVMSVVIESGKIMPDDEVVVFLPNGPFVPLPIL